MYLMPTKSVLRLALLGVLGIALAVFVPAGFTQDTYHSKDVSKDASKDVSLDTDQQGVIESEDINLDDLQNYVGRQVTLHGQVEDIYNDAAFKMEAKGENDILVISLMPETVRPEGQMKLDEEVTATGTVRTFDSVAMKQDYPSIDFGKTPLENFEGRPILILGEREFEAALQPSQATVQQAVIIEREKPSVTEPEPAVSEAVTPEPAPEPEPAVAPEPQAAPTQQAPAVSETIREKPTTATEERETLPRTASPLPLVGLSGLLSLLTGLGVRWFRS